MTKKQKPPQKPSAPKQRILTAEGWRRLKERESSTTKELPVKKRG